MRLLKKAKQFFTDKDMRYVFLANLGLIIGDTDERYLCHKFQKITGYSLDLDTPKTFNEKLQWLKLYDRNPLYTTLVDKVAVKTYVEKLSVKNT